MMREMDKRFASDGMIVSALFPGCIAESPLFREKRGWFRTLFPVFQKYVTKQFVSTEVREGGREGGRARGQGSGGRERGGGERGREGGDSGRGIRRRLHCATHSTMLSPRTN